MVPSDLIVPPPIPFADETVGELQVASRILQEPVQLLMRDVAGASEETSTNPKSVVERFLKPTGNLLVSFARLNDVAYGMAVADTLRKLDMALQELTDAVMTEDRKSITKSGLPGGTVYLNAIAKFRHWIQDPIGRKPPYQVFVQGNKKLPFWAFSALPGATCPGAGDCLVNPATGKQGWCYSFSAWLNITPYFRQLQNTLLIRLRDKTWIEKEARGKFQPGQVVRLYVDGDFDSLETLSYWMHFCDRFPDNAFYGYSKSWGFFEQWHKDNHGAWPSNYLLNLSSGTKLERVLSRDKFRAVVQRMLALRNPKTGLPVVRGTFRGLWVKSRYPRKTDAELFGKRTETLPAWNHHRAEVENAAKVAGIKGDFSSKGVFVCPGYCGDCLPGGKHACGDRRMRDMAIVIGIH